MRRYGHKILAALLCVCLLISYTPLPASAEQAGEGRPAPSVGGQGAFDAITGQATTEVLVETYEAIKLEVTASFAASIEEIDGDATFDLQANAVGAEPLTYAWSRAVLGEDGQPGEREALEGGDAATYPLSQHADTLVNNTVYRYYVKVTDAEGTPKEATVDVTVTDGYVERALPNAMALPRVHGLSIHQDAVLASASVDADAPLFGFLQQAADGARVDEAWQLDLAGAPEGKVPFAGSLAVTLPIDASKLPADATSVQVVGLNVAGETVSFTAEVNRATASASFDADMLGAFAVAYPVAAEDSFTVTAEAGAGGSVSPTGPTTYAKGARAVYTVLPDEGYEVASVKVDGDVVELSGNRYIFESVEADHRLSVEFRAVEAPDPTASFKVTAEVAGGNGRVAFDGGSPAESVEVQVAAGASATVRFAPDEGYRVDAVTVQRGQGAPETVGVFGASFLLAAVQADTVVTVSYRAGVQPPLPTHEVTAEAGAGGSASPASQTVPHAGAAAIALLPDEGYELSSVTANGRDVTDRVDANGSLMVQNVVEDVRVRATFALEPRVTIAASAGDGGSVSPNGERSVKVGQSATYYFYPDAGFQLDTVTLTGVNGVARDVTDQVRGGVLVLADVREDMTLTAAFRMSADVPPEDTYYLITASAGEGGSVSPAGNVRVKAGSSQTFYFTPSEGFTLESVLVNGQSVEVAGLSYTLSNIVANATVEAFFRALDPDNPDDSKPDVPARYIVSSSAGKGGSISPSGSTSVLEHGSLSFTFLPDAGFQLASVIVDGTVLDADDPAVADGTYRFDDVREDHKIHAAFERAGQDPDPGPGPGPDPDPDQDYYTVQAASQGAGSVSPAGSVRVQAGASQTFYFFPDEGNKLESVLVDGQPVEVQGLSYELGPVTADAEVLAVFAPVGGGENPPVVPDEFEVTVTSTSGGSVSPAGTTRVQEGGSLRLAFTPDEGFALKRVTLNETDVTAQVADGSYLLEDVRANHAVHAEFSVVDQPVDPAYRMVNASAQGGGSISPAGDVRVPLGGSHTFTLRADDGKKLHALTMFDAAHPDGLDVTAQVDAALGTFTLVDVQNDTRIVAQFADRDPDEPEPSLPEVRQVTATHSTGGLVSPAGAFDAAEGSTVNFSFMPDAGWHLASVTVNGQRVKAPGNQYVLTVGAEPTYAVHAQFERDANTPEEADYYLLTATVDGAGGAVSPAGTTRVAAGGSQTLSLLPDEGYVVDQVSVDGSSVDFSGSSYTLFDVCADVELSVSFKREADAKPVAWHTVTSTATAGGSVSPEGAVRVAEGAGISYTFTATEGYELYRVDVDAGTDAAQSFEPGDLANGQLRLNDVREDHAVRALYKKVGTEPDNPDDPDKPATGVIVKASAGEGGSILPAGDVPVALGGSQTFTFVPDDGYRTASVTVNGKPVAFEGNAYTMTDVQEAGTIAVAFERIPDGTVFHTVTASATTGGSITPSGAVQVEEHHDATFSFKADDGYQLDELVVDGQAVYVQGENSYTFQDVTRDHTIHAAFKPEPVDPPVTDYVTVSATAGPHGAVSPAGDIRVLRGESCTFALLPDAGYAVSRVLVNGADAMGFVESDSTLTLRDLTVDSSLRVEFAATDDPQPQPKTHVIEASATTGGTVSPAGSVRVVEGRDASFAFAADAGYRLASLEVDGKQQPAQSSYAFRDVREGHTIRAVFEPVQVDPPAPQFVTVHAAAGQGGAISPAGDVRVPRGASQMFTLLPDEGYAVSAVTANGQPAEVRGSTVTLFDITEDTDLRVSFERVDEPVNPQVTHTITAKAGRGGVISPAGATTVAEGGSVLYALIPHEGYRVDALIVDGVTYEGYDRTSYRFADVTEDHSIEVTFIREAEEPEQGYVTVDASAGQGGSISPAGNVVLPKGGTQTFYFFPEDGKRVDSLTVGGMTFPFSGQSYTLFNVETDTALSVTFAEVDPDDPDHPVPAPDPITHAVTASAGQHGTVSPEGSTTVIEGGALLLTFVPDAGYQVDEVTLDGETVQYGGTSYRLVDIADDAQVHVTFKQQETDDPDIPLVHVDVRVEATAEGGEGGVVSPSGVLHLRHGSSQTFHVFPHEGYDLEKVLVNGQQVQAHAIAAPTLREARASIGGAGGYRFVVEELKDDALIQVHFKKLSDGDSGLTPVQAHAVTASATSGGMISPSGTAWVADGGSIAYTLKPDAGWHLESLAVDGDDVTAQVQGGLFQLEGVSGDTEVRAVFAANAIDPEPAPYVTVHANATGNGRVSPSGDVRVKTGESQTFAFIPGEGSVLDTVEVNGRAVVPIDGTYTLFDLEEDADLRAAFREKTPDDPDPVIPVTFPVSASATSGGSVWPSGVTDVAQGGSLLFTFVPDEGYQLVRVLLDGTQDVTDQVSDGSFRLHRVMEPHTLLAEFAPVGPNPPTPEGYIVTATTDGNGTVTPAGAVSVKPGASQQFTFAPKEGYQLDSVLVDGRAVAPTGDAYTLFDVQANMTLHATFKRTTEEPPAPSVKHAVTASASEGGSISPSGTFEVADGGSVSFALAADDGYELRSLAVNGKDATASVAEGGYQLVNVREDTTVHARFAPVGAPIDPDKTFTVSAQVRGGHGSVSPSGNVQVAEGASQPFYFYPDDGFVVDVVEVDGVALAWSPSSFVFENVRGDHSLVVTFKPVPASAAGKPGGDAFGSLGSLAKAALTKTGDIPWAVPLGLLAAMALVLAVIARRKRRAEQD